MAAPATLTSSTTALGASASAGAHEKDLQVFYFIGVPELVTAVEEAIKTTPLSGKVTVLLDPAFEAECKVICGRDWRVGLLDGRQLVPYSLEEEDLWLPFRTLLPVENESIILDSKQTGTGRGLEKSSHEHALKMAKEHHIEAIEGKSCIEGGNCLLFRNKDGSPRAVVGILSIALTVVALEKQGYYEEHRASLEMKKAETAAIENDFYRKAKNRHLMREFLPYYNEMIAAKKAGNTRVQAEATRSMSAMFGGITGFKTKLLESVIEESQRAIFHEDAIELQAKWEMAKELISKELEVPLEHIAFIPQIRYHIDFHVFANNQGQVFLHDESLAQVALDACVPSSKIEKQILDLYRENSSTCMKSSLQWRDAAATAIAAIGCEVIATPGMFEDPAAEMPINFMNALLLDAGSESLLMTPMSKISALNEAFLQAVQRRTATKIAGIAHRSFDLVLRLCHAGLHCISWEKR